MTNIKQKAGEFSFQSMKFVIGVPKSSYFWRKKLFRLEEEKIHLFSATTNMSRKDIFSHGSLFDTIVALHNHKHDWLQIW